MRSAPFGDTTECLARVRDELDRWAAPSPPRCCRLLAIGVGLPFWLAGWSRSLAGGGLVVLLAPRQLFEGLDASGVARGKIELARELLTEAQPLASAWKKRDGRSARRGRRPGPASRDAARGILTAIERGPAAARPGAAVSDLLPAARGRDRRGLRAAGAQSRAPTRIAATGDLIDRLDTAFARYATELQDADLDKLDIELKLLKSSLDEDLGADRSRAPDPGERSA